MVDLLQWQIKKYNSKGKMSDGVRLYLIIETSLRLAVDAVFLVLYCIRINKLDGMASNNFHQKPKLMKFKIILLILLELMFAAHISLSYLDSSYWVHPYQEFALVSIADFINCFLQIYIIRKQHKKKSLKSIKLPLLWISWLFFDIANIVFVEIMIPSITVLLIIFEAMLFVALIVIGCLLEEKIDLRSGSIRRSIRQRTPTLLDNSSRVTVATPRSPLIFKQSQRSKVFSQTLSSMHDSGKLYVQFNKQFNVSMRNNQAFYQFKFAVIVEQQSHILTRTQENFMNLMTQMSRTFPQSDELQIKDKKQLSFSNIKQYGQEKQKIYETYLIKLTQNQKYYTSFLLDFLEISPNNRIRLTNRRQNKNYQKKDSLTTNRDQEQRHKKPFFNVEVVNNKIHISNQEILQVVVHKPKSEIEKFHNRLIAQKKLKMQLLTEEPDMTQLVHFIFRVVNSKLLWKSFSEWMVLGKKLEQKIFNMFDFWNYGFKSINISIIGYEIAFDKEGSIHNLYLISLSQKDFTSLSINDQDIPYLILKEDVTIKKRFNDFVKLDKHIKKFISVNNIKASPVLSLPPKFSPFGTKTSPKSRQIYLDMYLNQVLKIQGINHCVKFLQFLQVDLGRFREQFQKVDQENLVQDDISSIVIDELEQRI